MIPPEFQKFYYWTIEDSLDTIKVSFDVDESFQKNIFEIEFDREENTFLLHFLKYVPIIEGELYGKADRYEIIDDPKKFVIQIYKSEGEKREWPLLIRNVRKSTKKMDAHSAFDLLNYITTDIENRKPLFPDAPEFAYLLRFSVDSGYLPALLNGIRAFQDDPSKEDEMLGLLVLAADMYQSPEAIMKIGIYYFSQESMIEQSLYYLAQAFELGFGLAALYIGLILSPLSDVNYPKKNGKEALKYFESIQHPIALHEAAKLYLAGEGCQQNIQKAKEYQKQAEEISPDPTAIPPLDESLINYHDVEEKKAKKEASTSFLKSSLSAGLAIAGTAAVFYAAFKFLQKK